MQNNKDKKSLFTSKSVFNFPTQDRDTQKIQWIDRFIEELRTNDKWVIPALKQIREICSLFGEAPQNLR